MPKAYQILAQLAPGATTLTYLYIVPALSSVVAVLYVTNQSATAATFRIASRKNGDAIDPKHYIAYDQNIDGNSSMTYKVILSHADELDVYVSNATISFTLQGCLLT